MMCSATRRTEEEQGQGGKWTGAISSRQYLHNGKWYARFSAQVWVELSDFDYVADVYDKIGEMVRRGEHLQDGRVRNYP